MSSPVLLGALLERGYRVRPSAYVEESWLLVRQRLVGFVLFGVLASGISLIAAVFLGLLPFIGGFVGQAVTTSLMAGYLYAARVLDQKKPWAFSIFFKPTEKFVPILFYTMFLNLLIVLPVLLFFVLIFGLSTDAFFDLLALENAAAYLDRLGGLDILMAALFLMGFMIYLFVSYVLVLPFIVFEEVSFWQAMEASRQLVGRQFGAVLSLLLLLLLLNLAGALFFFVGLFITIPVSQVAYYCFYKDLLTQAAPHERYSGKFGEDTPLDAGI
ncbi:MAG: hypothetical protein ACFCUI_13230 [Bernardetiaceae bacterium]